MPESQRAISPVTEGREGQGLGHKTHTHTHTHKHEEVEKGTHRYPKTYACAHTQSKHNGRIASGNKGREESKDYSRKWRVCWFDTEGK